MTSQSPDYPVTMTTALLGFIAVTCVIGYRIDWALYPFVSGVLLSLGLWVGNSTVIRKYLRPEKISRKKSKKQPFYVFALIKYPLVAVCIWGLVRLCDTRQVMVFVAGYLLLHVVIVMRLIGKIATKI